MNSTRIIEMATAFYESCVLLTATELGLFATLEKLKQADVPTVAKACNLDERCTRLLMDACVALGLLEKRDSTYCNSPEAAQLLVPGSPHDITGALQYSRDVYAAWGKLSQLVRTGKPVERPELHLGGDDERTRRFVLSMHYRALGIGQAVIPCLRLEKRTRVLDVGGGPGTYSVLIAKRHPQITCTVLDLPAVIQVAKEIVHSERLDDRIRVIGGNYHETPFPEGNDVILFFGVLHQESPETIRALLSRAYSALIPGGEVYVMDMMTDETRTRPKFSALFALNMALTAEHGWVFSDRDLAGWLAEAGFTNFTCRPLPPPMPHWLASACRPQ